jgi:hypothetical protein
MPKKDWTLSKVKATWNKHRRLYFSDGEGRPVPLAKDLGWVWLAVGSQYAATTQFDADDDPVTVELNEGLRSWPALMRTTLLHEATHIRLGPDVACPSGAVEVRLAVPPLWKAEAARLVSLGACLL